ncbi:ABC transporter ATP-binding protein [Streptomyces sp. NPDC002032]|uniref:ABC transporter ATP-binding protein n=1 Tax=Streptomyces sp. NPDC002032 TaxID=3364630 RepID=UPI0036C2D6EB
MPTDRDGRAGGSAPALRLRAVTKRYGAATALDGVAFDIAEGEITGLLGHNGAGKTTLMSLVAGLLRPDGGAIEVLGVPLERDPRRARRLLGLAPQELGVYPPLTVRQNLRFFAELAGLRGTALRRRTEEVAEPLGLTGLLERRVAHLSGGEQRRVHTAMALLHRPRLLLLDEPTAGVDVETRARLIDFVRQLAAEGTAVCYSTHYLAEVEALDASVAVLDHGRLLARGTLAELVDRHGESAVELTFGDGPPPGPLHWPTTWEAGVLRVHVEQPHLAVPEVLAALGAAVSGLVNLRVVRPGLESAFLRLTGRPAADAPGSDAAAPDGPAPDGPAPDGPEHGAPDHGGPDRDAAEAGSGPGRVGATTAPRGGRDG